MSTSTKDHASASTRRAKADDKISTAETIARFIAEGVSGSGVKGLEGPAKTVLGIIVHYKRVRDNSALCKDVAAQIGALTETLKAANDTVHTHITAQALPTTLVQAQLGSSAELTNRIDQLQRRLAEIDSSASKLQNQTRARRTVLANRNADILKEMCDHLRRAREDFMLAGQLAVEIALKEVAAEVKANSARHREAELETALDKLPSADASYRASVHARHGHLLAGTREALLKELDDWAAAETDSQREHPFYILSGGAGTGKSTIAYELARRADNVRRLGASFFFMRGSALLSTTEVFFTTLARQLIRNVPALHENAEALIQGHLKHGVRQNLDLQAQDLFSGLLSQLPSDHPPVLIVVDAVDECTDSAHDLVCRMLYLMMDAMSHISFPVRVFVTSRPEVHIEDAFQAREFSSAQRFILHEIPRPVIDADIRRYCNRAISELPDGHRKSLLLQYPDAPDDLTDLAAGLFIYATTAIQFLKEHRTAITQAMDRLVMIAREQPKTALQRLDELYTLVLQSAFPPDFLREKRDSIRAFLGHVAVLQDHISPSALAALSGVSLENDILPVLDRLGAVLSFEPGNQGATMRPLHASFGEFLVDAKRCVDPEFLVNLAQHHTAVSGSCLTLMMRPGVLVANICRLPDPCVLMNEIDNLKGLIDKYLPAPVQYACKHWFVHLALSGGDLGAMPQLHDLCHGRLLEWTEAISFLDAMDRMLTSFPLLLRLCSPPDFPRDARELLFDIWRLVLEFAPAIRACPHQVYLSAVPMLPSSSKLLATSNTRQAGSPAFRCSLGIISEWPVWWDIHPSPSYGRSITRIQCAAIAPSGRWIAISDKIDRAVHLCHVDTGNVFLSTHALADDHDEVDHLCVSSNGRRLVSTSAKRVCVISTRSGAILHQLDNPAEKGLFSQAKLIRKDTAVLMSQDLVETEERSTLLIWDLATDVLYELSIAEDPDDPEIEFSCIAVSGTGHRAIVVVSTVNQTESNIGYFFDLRADTPRLEYKLQFSSYGSCFLSEDIAVVPLSGALCLLNFSTGEVIRKLGGDTRHYGIEASLDGAMVIGTRGRHNREPWNVIDVWTASGQTQTCIPMASSLSHVLINPQGNSLLAVTGLYWRTSDMQGLTATSPSAPPGPMHVGEMVQGSSSPRHPGRVAISYDRSRIALALAEELRILDETGTVVASMPLAMSPRDGSSIEYIKLAFSHGKRLIVTVTGSGMYLYDIDEGIVLGGCETPEDAIKGLHDDARLRRSAFGQADNFTMRLTDAVFTPDDAAVLALMTVTAKVDGGYLRALYTVQWDLRWPAPLRISALPDAMSLIPSNMCFSNSSVELDMDQNWGLYIRGNNYHGRPSTCTIPRSDWDTGDRGPNIAGPVTPLGHSFHIARDGWITERLSNRRVGWLPASRRPKWCGMGSNLAIRGGFVAFMSESGVLTTLNMSERS